MRRLLAASCLFLLLAACGPSRVALRPDDVARLGQRFDLGGLDARGQRRTVAELAGGRPALVDVWATWCKTCRQTLVEWNRLAERFEGRVAVVAISIDEDGRQIAKTVDDLSLAYPILWDRGGAEALSRLALEKVPTFLVLDGRGRVRHVHEGYSGRNTVDAIEAELKRLLAE